MNDNRNPSELNGSEARPNTPMPNVRVFSLRGIDLDKKKNKSMAKELDKLIEMELKENLRKAVKSIDGLKQKRQNSRVLHEHGYTNENNICQLNTQPSLPEIIERPNNVFRRQNSRSEKNDGNKENKNTTNNQCGQDILTQRNMEVNMGSQPDNKNRINDQKATISLPKIDTYCISHDRPGTGHGFSYMISTADLLGIKNAREKGRRSEQKVTKVSRNNTLSENALTSAVESQNMYLLFRAQHCAISSKENPFIVHTKPKRTRQGQRKGLVRKCNDIKNVVRLPDINEDVRKLSFD